jgi:hypothetical protein
MLGGARKTLRDFRLPLGFWGRILAALAYSGAAGVLGARCAFVAPWRFRRPDARIDLLRCNNPGNFECKAIGARIEFLGATLSEEAMDATWKTKWGLRRVRREAPTIEEALIAAEAMADDPAQRAEIAASLMGLPIGEVQTLAIKHAAKTRGRASLVAGRTRAVVVEYKRPRTMRPANALGKR